ncbi:MAG: phosphatidylglycerophosphatase A [Peptococcus niger]|nr:phosphatidylglycerophosphatase A [Peptococcus niger]
MSQDQTDLRQAAVQQLEGRGIDLEAIADLVLDLQKKYVPALTLADCVKAVNAVLDKQDVQYAVLTGLFLDECCEQGKMPVELQEAMVSDAGLFGIDEALAMSIANIYGTIGITNFGYLDKMKPGIIGQLDQHPQAVHTFSDDLVGAIAAAAAARLAHQIK